jgi:hypothetical protein
VTVLRSDENAECINILCNCARPDVMPLSKQRMTLGKEA